MKKLFTLAFSLLAIAISSYSQSNNWKLDGNNNATNSSFIGTINNEAFVLKANDTEGLRIKPNGDLKVASFEDNISGGMIWTNANGVLKKLSFTGSNTDFLSGNGTFLSLSSVSAGWSLASGVTFTNNNVGIGTNIAPEKLTVNGNILANGSISGTSINVIDIVGAGKEFKINQSLTMKGIDLNTPGSRNELIGENGDFYIQSEHNNNYNTIFNHGNSGKVGFGIVPTEAFHVGVKAKFDQDVIVNKIYATRISTHDSLLAFGDSSIYMNTLYNRIYGSPNTFMKGIALGNVTFPKGANSVAIGYRVRADGQNSVIIGRTDVSSSNMLVNGIDNSLMVGFNSDKPTLTVLPANGNGTYGKVGIGTANPNTLFHVHVETNTTTGGYGVLSTSNIPTTKSISVIHKDPSQSIDQENFVVYTNGQVYCREVFVKLGQLGDFVFDEDYDLLSYGELESYLKENHHLPGVPSEPEVLSGGLNVGEMQAKVLQKTEENTLYILDLNSRLEEKEKENEALKSELESLKQKQAELEAKMNEVLNKK